MHAAVMRRVRILAGQQRKCSPTTYPAVADRVAAALAARLPWTASPGWLAASALAVSISAAFLWQATTTRLRSDSKITWSPSGNFAAGHPALTQDDGRAPTHYAPRYGLPLDLKNLAETDVKATLLFAGLNDDPGRKFDLEGADDPIRLGCGYTPVNADGLGGLSGQSSFLNSRPF